MLTADKYAFDPYTFGPFRLDIEQRLLFRDDEQMAFSILKFDLLRVLVERRNRVVAYDVFWEKVWEENHKPTDDLRSHAHKVNVHIDAIRNILGKYGECIESLRGRGYRFSDNILERIEGKKIHPPKDAVQPTQSRTTATTASSNRKPRSDAGRDYRGFVASTIGNTDNDVIKEMARIFGKDEASFLAAVLRQKRPSTEFQAAEAKVRQERLSNRLLQLYYPDGDLRSRGLARYAFKVDGERVETNIVVSRKREPLKISLKNSQKQFRYVKRSSQIPSLPENILISAVANSLKDGVEITNDPVFCLHEFDPTLSHDWIGFWVAPYFEYRSTFGGLEHELVHALIKTRFNPEEAMRKREQLLRGRDILLPDVARLGDASRIMCVGGVNVVFALRRDAPHHDFAFFVGERSERVASAPGVRCLIPSGFHQPSTWGSAREEVSISASVFRELWEEPYRGDEVISHDGHLKSDWYFKYPELGWFRKKGAQFRHEIVSFGMHLKDGSYQFGILLVVDDPKYWNVYGNNMVPNYEFRRSGMRARVISTRNKAILAELLADPLCANASAFAISEALLRLKKLAPDRVALPSIEILSAS